MAAGLYRAGLVAAFLVFYALSSVVTPWHAAGHAYVTARPAVVTAADRQAALGGRLAAAMTRLRCVPPSMWRAVHPGVLPASVILKPGGTFQLRVAPWTWPAPRGQWTMALCSSRVEPTKGEPNA